MKSYGTSRATSASPERIWLLWSDPNNWNKWNSGIRACWSDGPLASGVAGTMETNRGTKHAVIFSDVHPSSGFSMTMSGPPFTKIRFTCSIVPAGQGSTIAQSVTFTGPMAFLFGRTLGPMMASHFAPVLDDLATAAEASANG